MKDWVMSISKCFVFIERDCDDISLKDINKYRFEVIDEIKLSYNNFKNWNNISLQDQTTIVKKTIDELKAEEEEYDGS